MIVLNQGFSRSSLRILLQRFITQENNKKENRLSYGVGHCLVLQMTLLFPICHQQKKEHYLSQYSSVRYLELIFSVVAIVLSVSTNCLVLFTIYKSKSYTSRFYVIVLSIAVSDSLMAIIVSPMSTYMTTQYIKGNKSVQNIQSGFLVLMFTLAIASICSLTFLNIDRYMFLKNPESYTSSLSKKRHFSILALLWGLSLGISNLLHLIEFRIFVFLLSIFVLAPSGSIMAMTLYAYWKHFSTNPKRTLTTISSTNNNSDLALDFVKRPSRATILSVVVTNDCSSPSGSPPGPSHSVGNTPNKSIVCKHYSLDKMSNDNCRKPSDTPSVVTVPGTTDDLFKEYATISSIKPKIIALECEKQKKRWTLGRDIYESRIVLTLAIMTGIYWITHCPIIFAGFYLYFCPGCNCLLLNALLSVVSFALMISSGLRPLIFVLRFSQQRDVIRKLFDRQRKRKKTYTYRKDENSNGNAN